jgi:chromosome segregation ATPase
MRELQDQLDEVNQKEIKLCGEREEQSAKITNYTAILKAAKDKHAVLTNELNTGNTDVQSILASILMQLNFIPVSFLS